MKVEKFRFTLTGSTPIIYHQDSVDWADEVKAWSENPDNRKNTKAGDDRSPAWRWIGCLYSDGTHACITSECLAKSVMTAAAQVPMPGGRGGKTFKTETMALMSFVSPYLKFTYGAGRQLKMADLKPLMTEKDFDKHKATVEGLGFELFVKRACINMSKHIRVRPRFQTWAVEGEYEVWDEKLEKALPTILEIAGKLKGLGDWRPSSRTPGPFGRFTAEVSHV